MSDKASSASVNVLSRHNLLCAHKSSLKSIHSPFRLGPFDQVAGFVPIQVVWVYDHKNDFSGELIPIHRLRRALEHLLDHYPHLTGRLQFNPTDGAREIVAFGSGAALLEARCSEPLDAFSSPGLTSPTSRRVLMADLPDAGNALLPPFDPTPAAVFRDSILAVQHTRFACGAVALGVRVHHTVCDGDGFFQVVRHLSEVYRSLPFDDNKSDFPSVLANPPHIVPYMGELVGGRMEPEKLKVALEFDPPLFCGPPPATSEPSSSATAFLPPPYAIEGRFIRFSSAQLTALKAKATNPNGIDWISSFEALCAHLYQRVHRARSELSVTDPTFGELSPTDFLTPINLRSALGLGAHYTPNALFAAYTTVPSDLLATGSLWQVAKAVHDLTRAKFLTSKEEVDRSLEWIAAQAEPGRIGSGFRLGNGSCMISQWNKFDIYRGMVFDDIPILAQPPFTKSSSVDGLGYVLPTEEIALGGDAGAIDVCLALATPVWRIMDQHGPLI
ncbi:anthranilate N-benzoyltransferase protein 3-like protein [Favolaschia claudopus]|uniref:Anthranilate N-benzoyltransferase protein 3-like protein n=1 Tax=Favolaschia claudopus TaxID=2862362 RepID=A0AAW0C3T3_9AGAR